VGLLGKAIYYSPPDEDGNVMVISDLPHECGWPERITYLDPSGAVVRSGCAGCEAELPVPTSVDVGTSGLDGVGTPE